MMRDDRRSATVFVPKSRKTRVWMSFPGTDAFSAASILSTHAARSRSTAAASSSVSTALSANCSGRSSGVTLR